MPTVAWLDGRYVDEPTVALDDTGYLLGDGVFVTMRGYDGVCFRAAEHLQDLARAAERFDIPLTVPAPSLVQEVDDVARRTGEPFPNVRVTLSRGRPGGRPTLSILGRSMHVPSIEQYRDGVPVVVVEPRRIPPACFDGTVKTISYAPSILARRQAEARGAFEGIQLAVDGTVACGTMSNVFVVRGDRLSTPPLASGCRDGMIRRVLRALANDVGLVLDEAPVSLADLASAAEVFLTSTRVECLRVSHLDGVPLPPGGSVAATLRSRLQAMALEEASARRRR